MALFKSENKEDIALYRRENKRLMRENQKLREDNEILAKYAIEYEELISQLNELKKTYENEIKQVEEIKSSYQDLYQNIQNRYKK